ncbi:hypothetical protein Shyd_85990 [Streptomyces hydrogenans]|uniref:Uncharacterized protein n=1 Tax=Streptomyces hydrogenans TaxID=1873719 RepID=A0ABQ3PQD8_9ACTN|nr:hypothetical protein GCM10018784_73770 [Streptomyces hydrogenans]GHI27228.1 hypothetical protein Shyd_85990 [Streptomyces hydrogenans]
MPDNFAATRAEAMFSAWVTDGFVPAFAVGSAANAAAPFITVTDITSARPLERYLRLRPDHGLARPTPVSEVSSP